MMHQSMTHAHKKHKQAVLDRLSKLQTHIHTHKHNPHTSRLVSMTYAVKHKQAALIKRLSTQKETDTHKTHFQTIFYKPTTTIKAITEVELIQGKTFY